MSVMYKLMDIMPAILMIDFLSQIDVMGHLVQELESHYTMFAKYNIWKNIASGLRL